MSGGSLQERMPQNWSIENFKLRRLQRGVVGVYATRAGHCASRCGAADDVTLEVRLAGEHEQGAGAFHFELEEVCHQI